MRTQSHTDDTMPLARTNLTLPAPLLVEVDALAGPRGRSRYVAEAVAQRLKRDKLAAAIDATEGVLARRGTGMTRPEVSAFVDGLRSEESD
jgi:hypothetical protein